MGQLDALVYHYNSLWWIQNFSVGAPTPGGEGQPIIWQNFYPKLHGNERKWAERDP